jgi:hypothetical protein
LIVLALLTARVTSGRDPALLAGGATVVQTSRGGHAVLRTTPSGRVLAGPPAGGGNEPRSAHSPLVSHSSGALSGGEHDD